MGLWEDPARLTGATGTEAVTFLMSSASYLRPGQLTVSYIQPKS